MAALLFQQSARRCALVSGRYQSTRFLSRRHGIVSSQDPVNLSFTSIIPENGNETENPLVILHGLLWVSGLPNSCESYELCNHFLVVPNETGVLFVKHCIVTCLNVQYMLSIYETTEFLRMRHLWTMRPWLQMYTSSFRTRIWVALHY